MTHTVLRIHQREDFHTGPFRAGRDELRLVQQLAEKLGYDDPLDPPGPYQDFGNAWYDAPRGYLFGFPNKEAYERWFCHKLARRALLRSGRLVISEVTLKKVPLKSDWQVAFDPDDVISTRVLPKEECF